MVEGADSVAASSTEHLDTGSEQDMTRPSTHAKRVATTLLRWTARLVLLAFALAVAGSLVVTVVLPRATHGSALTVLTGSMTPGIPVGSVVVVRPVDPGTLRVGDVVTYQVAPGKQEFITHRVITIDSSTSPTTFTLKGDANRGPDMDPVSAQQIRGKVWFHVPYIGGIRDALHGKGGITLVGMLALAGYALSQLSGAFQDRKESRDAPEETPAVNPAERKVGGHVVGRPLVLATLPTDRLAVLTGLTPAAAASQWGALLLDEDSEHCTLLVAPPRSGVVAAVELLTTFDPLVVHVWDEPAINDHVRADTMPLGAPAPPVQRPHSTQVDVAAG